MTTQPEALRLAAELSKSHLNHHVNHAAAAELRRLSAVEAQRDALLEALTLIDRAEFWINHGQKGRVCEQEFKVWLALEPPDQSMLYAAPPQRKPLTDDAMQKVFTDSFGLCPEPGGFLFRVGRAVERAHGIGGEG